MWKVNTSVRLGREVRQPPCGRFGVVIIEQITAIRPILIFQVVYDVVFEGGKHAQLGSRTYQASVKSTIVSGTVLTNAIIDSVNLATELTLATLFQESL